jgi:hypothetical protein
MNEDNVPEQDADEVNRIEEIDAFGSVAVGEISKTMRFLRH